MELSKTMQDALNFVEINGGAIFRHAGGFWLKEEWTRACITFGTPTIEALVSRGRLKYTEWQEGKNGKFPIKAEMTDCEKARRRGNKNCEECFALGRNENPCLHYGIVSI